MTRLELSAPVIICDSNLSHAWARALIHIEDHPGTEIAPLIMSITGFDRRGCPREDTATRAALDALLGSLGAWDVETVAFTIFPKPLWDIAGGDRDRFFAIFRETFPRYQALNRVHNRRGMYFERLTMYGRGPNRGNQLAYIIEQYGARTGVRRSMLQASVFDPERDHTPAAQLGFPCLQHVSFVPDAGMLTLNAFYATQQLIDKAYGNYLGLSRLGAFMAHEMGLRFARLTVYVGVAKLERISKSDQRVRHLLALASTSADESATASVLE